MMKTLIILSALFLFTSSFTVNDETVSFTPDEEKYKVIKVNGQIQVKKTGKNLSQGDEFLSNTPLDFKTPDSRAAVISPTKGRFVLSAGTNSKGSNLVPAMNSVATRSGALLNMIDLQNAFSGKVVIIDELKLKIGKDAFPMNDDKFFYVEYTYNGEAIPKMLSFSNDTLIFSRNTIFTIDGKQVENPEVSEMKLYYRNETTEESQLIGDFSAVFPDNDALKTELEIILGEMNSNSGNQKLTEVSSYINEYYGKPDKENIKSFLQKQFNIDIKD